MSLLVDRVMVAQGEGFIRRYIEIDIEQNKPGAAQAQEWFLILSNELAAYRKELQDLENKLMQAKIAIG